MAINPKMAHGLLSRTHESALQLPLNPDATPLVRGGEVAWRFAAKLSGKQFDTFRNFIGGVLHLRDLFRPSNGIALTRVTQV